MLEISLLICVEKEFLHLYVHFLCLYCTLYATVKDSDRTFIVSKYETYVKE
jgi:hypothetical protein